MTPNWMERQKERRRQEWIQKVKMGRSYQAGEKQSGGKIKHGSILKEQQWEG